MKHLLKFVLVFLFSVMSLASMGQADDPCDGGDPFDCPEIPIDGGASLILLAGAGVGIARIAKKRKANA